MIWSPWKSKQQKLCEEHSQKKQAAGLNAYIISTQHGYMEGQELHGDNSENALKAVHCVRDRQEIVCKLLCLRVILVTYDNRPPLQRNTWAEQKGYISRPCKPIQYCQTKKAALADSTNHFLGRAERLHKQTLQTSTYTAWSNQRSCISKRPYQPIHGQKRKATITEKAGHMEEYTKPRGDGLYQGPGYTSSSDYWPTVWSLLEV